MPMEYDSNTHKFKLVNANHIKLVLFECNPDGTDKVLAEEHLMSSGSHSVKSQYYKLVAFMREFRKYLNL